MGSAETSGVSEEGFGGPKGKPSHSGLRALSQPTSLVLIITMIAGAAFFAYDAARSIGEAQDRTRLVATLAAAQLSGMDIADISDLSIPPALADDFHLTIADADGSILYTSTPASELDAGGFITAELTVDPLDAEIAVLTPLAGIVGGVGTRGSIVLGLMALLGFGVFTIHARAATASATDASLPTIEAVPYGLAHWHEDGVLVCANSAFCKLLRLDGDLGRPGTPYGSVSRAITGKISARPVLDANRQRMIEVEREDGSVIMLDERPCPSGGFVTIITDITDRKAADRLLGRIREEQKVLARRYHEEKLRAEASSRAKTSFLAHLSHDIRTPLNHIIGFADLIRLETFGPLGDPKYGSYLDDIKRAGEQLLSSFAEILEFAELEAGRKALKRERIDISTLVADLADRYGRRAHNAGVKLKLELQGNGVLLADRHYLERMMANLLDNAIRFTERDGFIRLGAWVAQDGVVLEVTDTGAGMNAEQMSRLSQPFVLSDAAFARDHEGIGLGIATARTIAEQSGGRLAIDSIEGIGTTVAVSLPLAPAEEPEAPHHFEFSHAYAA